MITVYGRKTCAPCHQIARFLTSKGHPFKEVDIDQDEVGAARAYELAGNIVPVIEINGTVVRGLNIQALSKLL